MKKFEQVPNPAEKIGKYKEMIGSSKAIFVLSAGTREVNTGGQKRYRPDSYGDLDKNGIMAGGHARIIAAAEIAQYFPDLKIVTTSRDIEDRPTLAETYAQEIKKIGISEARIVLEKQSTNTLTELIEMVKISKNYDWENISILSNDSHLERVRVMLEYLQELAERLDKADTEFLEAWKYFDEGKKLKTHLLATEEILLLRDPRYKKIIEAVRSSDVYKKDIESEKKGVMQIRDGTYGKE